MESNNLKWYYKGKEIQDEDIPSWAVGFVYVIEQYAHEFCREGAEKGAEIGGYFYPSKLYVGKKLLTSTRKSAVGKRAMKKQLETATDKRRIKKVQVKVKDSGWRTYTGSCIPLNQEIKDNPNLFRKVILDWAHSKKHLGYLEVKHQMINNVLETDSWNDNILGKFYRKDFIKPQ